MGRKTVANSVFPELDFFCCDCNCRFRFGASCGKIFSIQFADFCYPLECSGLQKDIGRYGIGLMPVDNIYHHGLFGVNKYCRDIKIWNIGKYAVAVFITACVHI